MKKFKIIEVRQNEKGENFIVETLMESESKDSLKKRIDESKPAYIKDKNYRVKECE